MAAVIEAGPKKFALLNEELYKNLRRSNQMSEQLQSPQMAKVLSLDEQINQILANNTLPDFVKAKMYSEALSEYFATREKAPELSKASPIQIVPTVKHVETQVEQEEEPGPSRPSREEEAQQNRIDNVWEIFLANQDKVRVGIKEDSGQLTLDGLPIVDSNIDSILSYITRKRHPASMTAPRGTAYFLDALARMGLPLTLIPSSKLKGQMQQYIDGYKHQQKGSGKKAQILKWSKLFH